MPRRRLPIGIQTFRRIREEDCYYVDKTAYIRRLLDEGTHYFLSRPRRFGKSLFLDTCKELFEGNEALFEGLHIHDHWDWSVRYPVLRLSFGSGNFTEPGSLQANLMDQLTAIERRAGVVGESVTVAGRFARLLEALHERTGQRVAVLVDEYDKPILDALDNPEIARANRDFLRGLYATIKDSDADIRFSFITGVSEFSKVSLFSGLNNLIDLTLDSEFSAICGYTEADLDTVFAPELPGLERDEIRLWYNGYSWLGEDKVYNPFAILLLFRNRLFGAWWVETGTPAFLVETLFKRRVSSLALDDMVGSSDLPSTFDVDDMPTEALLFQTGYLTHRPPRAAGSGDVLPAGVLRGAGIGRYCRGQQQPRPPRHGGPLQRQRLPLRVQGGRDDAGGRGHDAVEGEALRRQVPRPGPAHLPGRRRVQQGGPQPGGLRGREGLSLRDARERQAAA